MGFANRRKNTEPHEPWPGLKRAARARYGEAFVLLGIGKLSGAMYLCGYVVEFLLKAAYCEFTGKPPGDNVYSLLQQDARIALSASTWSGPVRRGAPDLHSLAGLSSMLLDARSQAGYGDPILAGEVQKHILIIESHWEVGMRYSRMSPSLPEFAEFYRSVNWIRAHYRRLRSR